MRIQNRQHGYSSMKSETLYNQSVTILSGGVGGAKLVAGMAQCIDPSQISVIVNTADDSLFYGLHVSPDLDTVMYTLAGLANTETGWGIEKDTFNALSLLERYGQATWFRLGDHDLATHILRSKLLSEDKGLTAVTSFLARRLGVDTKILPMTDGRVETKIRVGKKLLPFQEYFVLYQVKVPINGVHFKGIQKARPTLQVLDAITRAEFIVIAPSNPVVSILPILSLPGLKAHLKRSKAFKVAVSPFVADRAFSGPAKALMVAIGCQGSSIGLARFYRELIDLMVIDKQDFESTTEITALGIDVVTSNITMNTLDDRVRLARKILDVVERRRKKL